MIISKAEHEIIFFFLQIFVIFLSKGQTVNYCPSKLHFFPDIFSPRSIILWLNILKRQLGGFLSRSDDIDTLRQKANNYLCSVFFSSFLLLFCVVLATSNSKTSKPFVYFLIRPFFIIAVLHYNFQKKVKFRE